MDDFRYQIARVRIANVKGIFDVEIDPSAHGNMIRIGGQNAAGKSSVLDAILYPISGRRSDAEEVIRRGALDAEVSIELEGRDGSRSRRYLICRKWSRADSTGEIKSTVTVKAVFDRDASNNPNATANIDSPQSFLKDLMGGIGIVDPHDFIRDFGAKQLGQLVDAFAPGENIEAIDDALSIATEERRASRDRVRVLTAECDAFTYAIDYLQNHREGLELARSAALEEDEKIKGSVDKLRCDRIALLSSVRDVVPGLSITEDKLFYKDAPLRDCSAAEQIRVGAMLSIAVAPALRVLLIRDGSLMDDDSLEILRNLAYNNDFQVWVEVVGPDADITIEGGRVK